MIKKGGEQQIILMTWASFSTATDRSIGHNSHKSVKWKWKGKDAIDDKLHFLSREFQLFQWNAKKIPN